jgi:hypothetical protein
MMSKSDWERQALGSIADGLAGSDPTLASMLDIFSRLASGEKMPGREKIRALRRRAAHCRRARRHPRQGAVLPQASRLYLRLGRQQAMLLLWAVISAGLIAAELALNAGGHRTCTRSMGILCSGQAAGPNFHVDQRARTHQGGWAVARDNGGPGRLPRPL